MSYNTAESQAMLNKFREGHLAEWVADIEKFLTPEEIAEVHAKVVQYRSDDRTGSGPLLEVQRVAQEVKDFVTFQKGNAAHWLADGLLALTGWDCRLDLGGMWGGKDESMTLEVLKARVAEAIAEEEEEEESNYGPFWNEDVRATAEAWLSTTPYRLWKMVTEIENRALDSVREGLFAAASGRDREWTDPAKQILADWEAATKKWDKDWKRRQKVA